MVNVTLWHYVKFNTRLLRFERNITLSAIPFPGAEIDMDSDYHTVGRVVFKDGGGVTAICRQEVDSEGEEIVLDDSEIEDTTGLMTDAGWRLLSDVERKYV